MHGISVPKGPHSTLPKSLSFIYSTVTSWCTCHIFIDYTYCLFSPTKDRGLPQWLRGKESSCNEGATEDMGSIPGSGRSPGEGNGTRFGNLAWKIPWAEEPWGLQSIRLQRVRHDRRDWAHIKDTSLFLWLLSFDVFSDSRRLGTCRSYSLNICWIWLITVPTSTGLLWS